MMLVVFGLLWFIYFGDVTRIAREAARDADFTERADMTVLFTVNLGGLSLSHGCVTTSDDR